jgi:hypothetical protein
MKTLRFYLLAIFWSIRHGSLSRGAWIAAYETHKCN